MHDVYVQAFPWFPSVLSRATSVLHRARCRRRRRRRRIARLKKWKKKWGRNGWTRNSIRSRDRFVSNYYAGHIIRVAWLPVEATPRRSPSAHAAKRRDASRGRTNRSTDVELGRGGTNRAKVSTFHLFIILRSPRYPRIFVPVSFLSFRRVSNFSNLWDMSIFIKKILRSIYPSMIHVSKNPF